MKCTYDHMGRRATKKVTSNGSITLHQRYIYRGYLQIACCDLSRSNHPCLWLITWDPTQPVATRPLAIRKDGSWFAYGWDLTKNVCEVFGPAGYIRTSYTYTPYGEVSESGDITQPIQWSSEFFDMELGLVYYNYRHYNPLVGKWQNRDSCPDVWKYSEYDFVKNQPILRCDSLGLFEDRIEEIYNEMKKSLNQISSKSISYLKEFITSYNDKAKLKTRFNVEKKWNLPKLMFFDSKFTAAVYVSSDGCCLNVSFGGQFSFSAKGKGLITVTGGASFGAKGGYNFCWKSSENSWTGSAQGGGWVGIRFGLDAWVAEAFAEVGVSVSYKHDFATKEGGWGMSVYGRAVFKAGWIYRQYRITYGNSELDFD